MNIEHDQIVVLVTILARVDAIFAPVRDWSGGLPSNAGVGQRMYPVRGVAWTDPGNRVDAQRVRDALAGAGFVRTMRHRGSDRTTGLVLLPAGEAVARRAADLPNLAATLGTLDWLWQLRTHPDNTREASDAGTYTRETVIVETSYDRANTDPRERQKLVAAEELLLAALIRGWAKSGADVHGRVWYALSPALAAGPMPSLSLAPPEVPDDLPEADEDHRATYYREFAAARARMGGNAEDPRELGMVPIACSPLRIGDSAK
ncbi:MAG TPA: hypothetical protein VGI81_19850 [Tepidisphaeraceae bacterium]|jgi:hypothetical protein